MKGVANLSAGRVACRFMGMVGRDSTAEAYRHMLQQQGVQPVLLVSALVRFCWQCVLASRLSMAAHCVSLCVSVAHKRTECQAAV